MGDLARLVAAVDVDGPAEVHWIVEPGHPARAGRVGLLPGSFNPPTEAHVALAAAGRAAGLDGVVYLLSKRTVDKERVIGLDLAERLALLRALATDRGEAVAFVNRGLYVDLARATREALPTASELVFLVGYDKIVQIFDPRYYRDRDAALGELFELSRFLVSPRGDADVADLGALLDRPENRPFAGRVAGLDLPARYREVSSTRARSGLEPALPPVVRAYLDERGLFDRA